MRPGQDRRRGASTGKATRWRAFGIAPCNVATTTSTEISGLGS